MILATMYHKSAELVLSETDVLTVSSVHFSTHTLIQVHHNDQLNTTYVATPNTSSLINPASNDNDKYQLQVKLGNSNDMKLPIIVNQIIKLYDEVILPLNLDNLHNIRRSYVVSLGSKVWESDNADFTLLMKVLTFIKNMYVE